MKRKTKQKAKRIAIVFLIVAIVSVCYFIIPKIKAPIMSDFIPVIKEEDIDSYIMDNPNVFIYFSDESEQSIRSAEKKIKNLIEEKGIKKEFVFLDYKTLTNVGLEKINQLRSSQLQSADVWVKRFPNILIVEEKQITNVLYKEQQKLNHMDLEIFLKQLEERE